MRPLPNPPALRVPRARTAAIAVLLLATLRLPGDPGISPPPAQAAGEAHDHAAMDMSEQWMQARLAEWFATHPARGERSTQVATAIFTVQNYRFDADGNAQTQVDSVAINVGETVMWQWLGGLHTTTNGVSSSDPEAGTLWNQQLDAGNQQFSRVFDTPGRFAFFCEPHELGDMKGVILVKSPVGVGPGSGRLGFVADPHPNPTGAGADFRFALDRGGRVQAEVYDVRGRRVARIVDRELDPGEHGASWDGRLASGSRAPAGIYYVRLRLPGYVATRNVVLSR